MLRVAQQGNILLPNSEDLEDNDNASVVSLSSQEILLLIQSMTTLLANSLSLLSFARRNNDAGAVQFESTLPTFATVMQLYYY